MTADTHQCGGPCCTAEPSDAFVEGYSAARYGTRPLDLDDLTTDERAEWRRGARAGLAWHRASVTAA